MRYLGIVWGPGYPREQVGGDSRETLTEILHVKTCRKNVKDDMNALLEDAWEWAGCCAARTSDGSAKRGDYTTAAQRKLMEDRRGIRPREAGAPSYSIQSTVPAR